MTTIERYYEKVSQPGSPLRVTMLGIRGFPNVQGGAENHAQNLSVNLSKLGCDVEVIVRSPHVPKESSRTFGGIKLVRVWSPRMKGVETFVHTFFGVLRAAWTRPDILHIHSVGPALFTPLARACGLRVVVTHHLLNYENEKWGPGGAGDTATGRARRNDLRERPHRGIGGIGEPHGARLSGARAHHPERDPQSAEDAIDRDPGRHSTSTPGRYALTVARIDEQKRQLDLIAAFAARRPRRPWKLAIVGGADYSSEYARTVAQAARETAGVVLLGHQTGDGAGRIIHPCRRVRAALQP